MREKRCTLVAGPPASGKTTYVRERMEPGDLIIDWDEILAAISGLPVYEQPEKLTLFANVVVKKLIGTWQRGAKYRDELPRHMWIIRTAPEPQQRAQYAADMALGGMDAEVVILLCPADVCHARIDADDRRSPSASGQHEAVDDWWKRYAKSPFDNAVRWDDADPL